MVNYPTSLDTLTNPVGTNTLDSPDHAGQHSDINDIGEALQVKVGVSAGSPVADRAFVGSGNGTSGWTTTWNNAVFGTPAITGGTATSQVLGTPEMGAWTTSGTTVASVPARGLAPTVVTLTDAVGTITPNAPSGQVFHMILGTTAGNRTFAAPLNATEGQAITFRVKQNTNNTGTLVFNSIYRMNDGGTPVLGTESTYNYVGFRFNTIDTKWDHQGNSLGVI